MRVSLLSVAILISLSSCCKPEFIVQDLSGKIPPPLRDLTEEELLVVTDSTYERIVKGEKRIQTLQGLLESTRIQE